MAEISRRRQETSETRPEEADPRVESSRADQAETAAGGRTARGERADTDRIELSSAARELAEEGRVDPDREARVRRLAQEYQDGTLLSVRRMEETAARMLGG